LSLWKSQFTDQSESRKAFDVVVQEHQKKKARTSKMPQQIMGASQIHDSYEVDEM